MLTRLIAAAGLACLTGCASGPAELADASNYRETDRINRFLDFEKACQREGGILIVQASGGLSRSGIPRPSDRYACRRRSMGIVRP